MASKETAAARRCGSYLGGRRGEEDFGMAQRRLIRAGSFLRLGKMRAVLLDWHLGYVLGIAEPTAPAWQRKQRSETP